MPEESAVMDAPETGAIETESTSNLGETGSESGETGSQQTEAIDTHDEPQTGETNHLRGKELYRAVKDKLRNGEKLSAQEQRSIRNAIHIAGRADEATGGDLGRFETERAAYEQLRQPGEESLTPEQVVESIRGDREQLKGIFDDLERGGDALLSELAQDKPEALAQMTFKAMDMMAQANNTAFSTYVAKSAFSYLVGKQIPLQFTVLDTFLPESSEDKPTQAVINAVKAIKGALQGLGEMAAQPLDMKKAPAPQQNASDNGNQGQNAENRLRQYEWDQKAAPVNRSLRDSELKAILSGRKTQLTAEEAREANAAIKEEWETRLKATSARVLQGYIEAGNERAYTDTIASKGKLWLPGIVQRHVAAVIDKRKPAAAKPAGQQNGTQKPAQQQARTDATGTVWLSGSPATLGLPVDHIRTTQRMQLNNEAYIKGKRELHKWKARVA